MLRARHLGVLTPAVYESKIKYMSRMGWRQHEPGPQRAPERPDLLNQAIGLLESNGVSLQDVADSENLLNREALLDRLNLTPRRPLSVEL